ncbi:MAG TPA: DUF4926 domain-containing protein [Armatimonadota bacterium]|jgi:hypothetical protein
MKPYDVVELLTELPEHGLAAGALGTVLEADKPGLLLVEFDPTEKDDFPVVCLPTSAVIPSQSPREAVAVA